MTKTFDAARQTGARGIVMGGGVTANAMLRERMRSASTSLPVLVPSPDLCVDNAAMIAACAYFHSQGHPGDGWALDVFPSLSLG